MVRKTVKLGILSSVATLVVHKSEIGLETNCYKYKRKTIEVILEWFLATLMVATSPRISISTLSLHKIRVFLNSPQCLYPFFLEDEKRYRQTVFTIVNYIQIKACVWNVSKIGRNWDSEKLLQTISVLRKSQNWLQLKIHSGRTTHQRKLGVVLNGRKN